MALYESLNRPQDFSLLSQSKTQTFCNISAGRHNGRVDLIQPPSTQALFKMFDRIPVKECVTYRNPTTGIFTETDLIKKYFSSANINLIQKEIQEGVLRLSNGRYQVGPQNCDTLKIIMRSIYLQYSLNQPENIDDQIRQLNSLVLTYCIENVYNEAKSYMKYLYDVSNLYQPMEYPIYTAKDKTLEFKSFF